MEIILENISFKYDKNIEVIGNIDYSFVNKKFYVICGPNGSGKTTLLKIISGIYKNYHGNVYLRIDDSNLEIKNLSEKIISKYISFVPSEVYTPFNFTVENIMLMGRRRFKGFFESYTKEDKMLVENIAFEFGIYELLGKKFNELSMGEKQITLIAQALVQDTDIILVDEPTAHLDPKHKIKILDILKKLVEMKNKTIIAVMHDIFAASKISDEMIFIKKGKIMLNIKSLEFSENIIEIASIFDVNPDRINLFI
ncbi:MAG: ABC transporter ATP-binding protein [Elusimicrobiales bacterium]|nr:ABC transporter ATP-binding protein [Elusimicrobiales bacterium]